ncbi:MAG: RNA polymerase sigma factor [Gemmatimonadales bacterium]
MYDAHTPAMYRLALRQLGGDAHAAEEVVHEAWIRGAERMATFRGDAALRTWLCGFVIRVAHEAIRQMGRDTAMETPDPPAEDRRLTGVFDRVDLERAIGALAPGFRQVLVLHDIEGYTHEEIAGLLDIVPGTSKSQLARARAALRLALTGGAHA